MKTTKTFIDPPNGWKYGFPKEFPNNVGNIPAWLVENGYPQEIINKMGPSFYYKIFTEGAVEDDS